MNDKPKNNNKDLPPDPEKLVIIDRNTTRKLREKWQKMSLNTTQKKQSPQKDSDPDKTILASENLQIPKKPLSKEDSEILKVYMESKKKHILGQFKIDEDKFSKFIKNNYTFLCKNLSTYAEAIEYFEKHIYKEIIDKITNQDL